MASKLAKLAAHASSHEYPDVKKVKYLRKQNFKDEANYKQLERLQLLISKLDSCEKYPYSFVCFCCVQYC